MRFAVLLLAALALASPAAEAQATPTLDVTLLVPEAPLAVNDTVIVRATVERQCPNVLGRYDESTLEVSLDVPPGFRADYPESVTFPEALCIQGGGSVVVDLSIQALTEAKRMEPNVFALQVALTGGSLLSPTPPARTDPFTLVVEPDPAPAVVEEEPERESPGLGMVGALLALSALATVFSRRRA